MWGIVLGVLAVQLGILLYNLAYWRGRRLCWHAPFHLHAVDEEQGVRGNHAPLSSTADAGQGRRVALSILVPARNEVENLPRLLESLAPQWTPAIECWVCDDGSDDGTTEWLQAHAERLGVQWFRGAPRPEGWVGKNWACYQLAARAQGEWLLFLDADLRCGAGFLAAMQSYLSRTDAHLVSAIPAFAPASLPVALLKLMVPFAVFTLLPLPLAEGHPHPAFAFANGQVIAFRKADYLRWLPHLFVRGAVLEDVALAALVKRHRGRVRLLDARACLTVSMYPTLRRAVDGFAKNAVAICRTVPMAVFVGLMLTLAYLYPLWALLAPAHRLQAAVAVLMAVAIFGLSARVVGLPFRLGWLYSGSVVLGLFTLARSIVWYRRGTIVWKGRFYRARS
ncbi:MAG: glycosyltransferase family 2 protein [Fimbriimonadales bacterium]|nr:glycosyltransferase family 2 protein [Fimbriimonadales bacterium]